MEELIFRYFLQNLESYNSVHKSATCDFEELMADWSKDRLDSPIYFNRYINDFFLPELNISAKELLTTLKQERITFKEYILGIMNKFNVKKYMESDNLFTEGVLSSSASDEEKITAKQTAINTAVGEDIDTSKLTNDELDDLLVKVTAPQEDNGGSEESEEEKKKGFLNDLLGKTADKLNLSSDKINSLFDTITGEGDDDKKIECILQNANSRDRIIECLCKYVGFHKDEAEYIADEQ